LPSLTIVRGPNATSVRRSAVPTFALFAVKNRDGRLGTEYAHIGCNGRAYAVNLDSAELASSENMNKQVTLTGKWAFDVTRLLDGREFEITRSQVRPGDVFRGPRGTEYAAIGAVNKDRQGWLSVPMNNPDNHAIAENGDTRVTVVGSFKMVVTSTK
jgi:hypothetical protein